MRLEVHNSVHVILLNIALGGSQGHEYPTFPYYVAHCTVYTSYTNYADDEVGTGV